MRWISLISSGHSIQMQTNTPSAQMHMGHSPGRPHLGSQIKPHSKFKKTEIISRIFSDHNAMRLDINHMKNTVRNTNARRLNNAFLNNQKVTEDNKREIKKFLETNDNENMKTQNIWDGAKAVLREKFRAIKSHLKKQEKQ